MQMSESSLRDPGPADRDSRSKSARHTARDSAYSIWKSFLEPIGDYSTYGGLLGQRCGEPTPLKKGTLVTRRISEAKWNSRPGTACRVVMLGLPIPWEPLYPDQGSRYAPVRGDAGEFNTIHAPNVASGKGGGRHWKRSTSCSSESSRHSGSLWPKHVDGNYRVKLSLRRRARPAEMLAASLVQAQSDAWANIPFHLELESLPSGST